MEHDKFVAYYEQYFGRWPVDPDKPDAGEIWGRVIRDTPEFEAEQIFDAVAAGKRGMRNPRVSDFKAALAAFRGPKPEPVQREACGLCGDTGWMVGLFWRAAGERVWHMGHFAPKGGEVRRGTMPCLCSLGYRAESEAECPRERREAFKATVLDMRAEAANAGGTVNEYLYFLNTPKALPAWTARSAEYALAHRAAIRKGAADPLVCTTTGGPAHA